MRRFLQNRWGKSDISVQKLGLLFQSCYLLTLLVVINGATLCIFKKNFVLQKNKKNSKTKSGKRVKGERLN